ncbi:surface-adhesin E family protein [Burkholderia stagnalis]|uniref:surface-adhesin E family protein n=1 Tax=Burkholderia stagnalis TaxID=1503054 RepID=UPI003D768E4B
MISNDHDRELYLDRQSIRNISRDRVAFTVKSVFKHGRRPVGATEIVGVAQTDYMVDCSRRAIQEDRTQYMSDEDKPVGEAPYIVRGWSTIRPGSDLDEIRKKVC